MKLHLMRFENKDKKPGPVFRAMAQEAYEKGAQWFFRVNDDTEILGTWATAFTRALQVKGEGEGRGEYIYMYL